MRKFILLLCLLAGVARAATDKVPLTVSTNGQIEAPTNFWAAQVTNARFVTAVQAVSTNQLASLTTASNALVGRVTDATNDLWGHTLTASNAAVFAASNAAYTASAAVTASTITTASIRTRTNSPTELATALGWSCTCTKVMPAGRFFSILEKAVFSDLPRAMMSPP